MWYAWWKGVGVETLGKGTGVGTWIILKLFFMN